MYGGLSGSKRRRTSGGSKMKLPSLPRLLLIFLDIMAILVLVHLNRTGVIGGIGYFIGLFGTVTLFTFLFKLAREKEEKTQLRECEL